MLYNGNQNGQETGEITFRIVHSNRKTMALQVTRDGQVVVRCPLWVSDQKATEFARRHRDWIEEQCRRVKERVSHRPVFTDQEVRRYREAARQVLTKKTAFWAERMGVSYGRIAIRQQVTRWGSCSAKGNLNYNWMLILVPETLQDYVVVHELAHRKEMNHSPRFWKVVESQLPDYKERRRMLKQYENQADIREEET